MIRVTLCRDVRECLVGGRPLLNGKTCHHNTVTGRTDRASLQRATRRRGGYVA